MDQIGHLLGINMGGIKPLAKTENTAPMENINFKTNPTQVNKSKLNFDTVAGLKMFELNGKITVEMADDLLATPYVALDLNS